MNKPITPRPTLFRRMLDALASLFVGSPQARPSARETLEITPNPASEADLRLFKDEQDRPAVLSSEDDQTELAALPAPPVQEPDPEPLPESQPEPVPESQPEPVPESQPESEPVPESQPESAPEPVPEPAPAPIPEPAQDTPWSGALPAASGELELARAALIQGLLAERDQTTDEGDRIFVERIAKECNSRRLDFPLFPDIVMELDSVLRKPNSTVKQVARVVRREPKLLQRVWQSANSINFAEKVSTLDEAILRVGFEPLWRMAMRACMNAPVFRVKAYQSEVNEVRGLSLVTAEVAGVLCRGGDVYIAGLLHAIGKLVFFRAAEFRTGIPAPDPTTVARLAQRYHPAVGVLIAHALKMPPEVCQAIAFAPDPSLLMSADSEKRPPLEGRAAADGGMSIALAVRAGSIAAHTAAASRARRELPGIQAIASLPGNIDAGRLIARAHSAWNDYESDTDPEATTDPRIKAGRAS